MARRIGILTLLMLILATLAALFAWITPDHYPPWPAFHGELAMAVALVCAGAVILANPRREDARISVVAVFVLVVSILPFVQFALGKVVFFGDALLSSLYLQALALSCWVGFSACRLWSLDRVTHFIQMVVLTGSVVSCGLALYQWQGLDDLEFLVINILQGTQPYANLIQPNNLATLLVLGCISVGFLYETRRVQAGTAMLSCLFLGFGIVLTQSRAGILELLVGGVIILLKRRTFGRITPAAVFALGVTLFAGTYTFNRLAAENGVPTGRDLHAMTMAGTRPIHWLSMIDAVGRQPISGYGWNEVSLAQYSVAVDHIGSGETIGQSHNLILDLLVWNGIPIGLLIVLAIAYWFVRTWVSLRTGVRTLTFVSVSAAVVHSLVEFPLYYTYFLIPVGMLIGTLGAETKGVAMLKVGRVLMPVVFAVSTAASFLVVRDYLRLEEDVRRLRFVQQINVANWKAPSHQRIYTLTHLEQFWRVASTPAMRSMSATQIADDYEVMRRFPSKENIIRYSVELAINGRPQESAESLRRICKMNSEEGCDAAKSWWAALGKYYPEVATVAWPSK